VFLILVKTIYSPPSSRCPRSYTNTSSTGLTAGDGSAVVSGCCCCALVVWPLALAEAPALPLPPDDAHAIGSSLPFLLRDLLLALNVLDTLCINCLGDTAPHRDAEAGAGAFALARRGTPTGYVGALSLGVIGRGTPTGYAEALSLGVIDLGAPTGCAEVPSLGVIGRGAPTGRAGALSVDRLVVAAAAPLEPTADEEEAECNAREEDDEGLCIDELTVGRRKDDTGLSDAAAEGGRDESGLRELHIVISLFILLSLAIVFVLFHVPIKSKRCLDCFRLDGSCGSQSCTSRKIICLFLSCSAFA
jgi:hypothetical protein